MMWGSNQATVKKEITSCLQPALTTPDDVMDKSRYIFVNYHRVYELNPVGNLDVNNVLGKLRMCLDQCLLYRCL